jgi:hypothetical protein
MRDFREGSRLIRLSSRAAQATPVRLGPRDLIYPGGPDEVACVIIAAWVGSLACARDDTRFLQTLLAQQVGTILACPLLRLLSSPRCNLGVISAQQDFRHFPPAKLRGTRVLRRFQ